MLIDCPKCQARVEAKEIGGYQYLRIGDNPSGRYVLLNCGGCEMPVLVQQNNVGNMAEGDIFDGPFVLFPTSDLVVNKRAPKPIRRALEEAIACFRARAYTASAIMCRKTLEGVCTEHGVKGKNLMTSLEEMRDKDLIDKRLFEWSDALRLAGNEAAHGVDTNFSKQDAEDILDFANAIVDYLFSYRDQFQKFMDRRQKNRRKA
jgi:hypothetical protein